MTSWPCARARSIQLLQAFGIGDEAEGDLRRQAFDGGAGGHGIEAEAADDDGDPRAAVGAERAGIGLGRHPAVRSDDRQGAVGPRLAEAGDRGGGQGAGGDARCGYGRAIAGDGRAVGQGDDGLAAQGGIDGGAVSGQILPRAIGTDGEGLQPGRGRGGHGRLALQRRAGRGGTGAGIAQHGDEQGGGAEQQQAGTGDGDRRLLQETADRGEVFAQRPAHRGRSGGGGEDRLALGEHGQDWTLVRGSAKRTPSRLTVACVG